MLSSSLLYKHPITMQTLNYNTDIQLQYRHPTTVQTLNYNTEGGGMLYMLYIDMVPFGIDLGPHGAPLVSV